MGFFDFLNKPIPGLNKPNPQMTINKLKEAVAESEAYARQGDKENALKVLLKYKDQGWDKPNFVTKIGLAYYKAGNASEAIECYRRAVEINPENGTPYILMGRALFDGADYENAALSYAEAMRLIEKDPGKYEKDDALIACAWHGASLIKSGKTEEGEAFIRKAEAQGYTKGDDLRQYIGMPMRTSDHIIPDAPEWNTYTKTLFSKMPFLKETLRPGVPENSIKTAEAEIGFAFPEDLKNLYLTNDGDNDEVLCGMLLGFRFLSLKGMLNEWRSMKKIAVYADEKWLPFGSDDGGNFIAVNMNPDSSGKTGRVIVFGRDVDEEFILAESLGALFDRFTRIIMSDDFYVGEYDGEEVIWLGKDDEDEGAYLIDYLRSENSVK
ncbi:MAG: SMI1/KNR4 family protein [Lachnospiraceae bacterium]|nr:SMI1/KNR4 family protein [Lachnospiraceae bacterium]